MKRRFFESPGHDAAFDNAPAALWLADFSRLKILLDRWRAAGVTDLRDWLNGSRTRVKECADAIAVLAVNQHCLALLGGNLYQLTGGYGHVLTGDLPVMVMDSMLHFWNGRNNFTVEGNIHALSGQWIDVRVEVEIRPGHEADWSRVRFAIHQTTDETTNQTTSLQLARSEAYARGLFEQSPVSLWVEDFSAVKIMFNEWRQAGVTDLQRFFQRHPEWLDRCVRAIRVLDVNQQTLKLYAATDKVSFLNRLSDIFQGDVQTYFSEELVELWNGKLILQHEVVNYTLAGEPIDLLLQLSVMPGCEQDWSRVLVALTDITARKKAEASLAYLGKYDVLTGVYNRSFFVEEIGRLEKCGPYPVSVIMADLNGLKPVNDKFGHAAGDAMLRRAGAVLTRANTKAGSVARIGGDEFVLLMPDSTSEKAERTAQKIAKIAIENNRHHAALSPLSFSVGHATCEAGGRIEATIQHADQQMYEAKRAYYAAAPCENERRASALN
jgi:diguanylate cyclase (GGDEF)-like protein